MNQPIKERFSLLLHQIVGNQGVSNISKTIVMLSVGSYVGGRCNDPYVLHQISQKKLLLNGKNKNSRKF